MQSDQHRPPLHGSLPAQPEGQAIRYDLVSSAHPHRLQVGETTVNIRFRAEGPSLQQKMTQLCQEGY